jgi:hypothetical protein
MRLIDVLREALLLLAAGIDRVVIARGQALEPLDGRSQAFQWRLRHDAAGSAFPAGEARSWLGGQWSDWTERVGWLGGAGFDVCDVLATDWRILT